MAEESSTECFQLKGSVLTTIIIELHSYAPSDFVQLLESKIEQAPSFFHQCPVILDIALLDEVSTDSLNELVSLCEDSGLQPIGFKGETHAKAINQAGLTLVPEAATRAKAAKVERTENPEKSDAPRVETVVETEVVSRPTKVIETPVRSGQQVYAADADLVVLGHVSEGAEVIADGDIHIYGALRGRALAGVKGNESARIFCQQLQAELLSIAGNFVLSDSIDQSLDKSAVQVVLDAQSLQVKPLY